MHPRHTPKLNEHKTASRRRLCTFSLCFVSTGWHYNQFQYLFNWQQFQTETFKYFKLEELFPADTDVLRRLQDVLKRSRRLATKQDVVMTSGKRRLIYVVLKTSNIRRLEDVWFTLSWRCPIYNVLKTSDLWRLQDVCKTTFV